MYKSYWKSWGITSTESFSLSFLKFYRFYNTHKGTQKILVSLKPPVQLPTICHFINWIAIMLNLKLDWLNLSQIVFISSRVIPLFLHGLSISDVQTNKQTNKQTKTLVPLPPTTRKDKSKMIACCVFLPVLALLAIGVTLHHFFTQ